MVEATEKSGSLVSARLALEQGRELFALPGSLHNVQARGCLQLLRNGATLVRHVEDILAELQHWAPHYWPMLTPSEAAPAEKTSPAAPRRCRQRPLPRQTLPRQSRQTACCTRWGLPPRPSTGWCRARGCRSVSVSSGC